MSEPVRVDTIEAGLRTLQGLVGGDIQAIARGDWQVYLNADAVVANLPPNLRAAQLMNDCGLDIAGITRGTAVLLGQGDHGAEADVPRHLIRLADHLFDVRLVA